MVLHLACVGNLRLFACTKELLKCLIVCLQTERFLWFRDNFFLDSCLQHSQRLLIAGMIGSLLGEESQSMVSCSYIVGGKNCVPSGSLCNFTLLVGGLFLWRISFFGIVRRWIAELFPDIALLEIFCFPSVDQRLVPQHCPIFGLIFKKREGVGAFWMWMQVWD